jgi:PhnB protein
MAKKPKPTRKTTRTKRPARANKPAKKRVAAIPPGMRTVTPYLTVRGADGAIDFYAKAFGARERTRLAGPDGRIMHAEIRIGDSIVFLSDEMPGGPSRAPDAAGGTPVSIHLLVPNVERAFQRAIDAGARVTMPLADMFWGDRFGVLADPYGHVWSLAQHVEDVSPKRLRERAASAFAAPPPG